VFVSQRSRNFQEGFSKGCSASDLTVMNKKGGGKPRSANVGVTRGKRGLKRELYKKGSNARAKLAPHLKMWQRMPPTMANGAVTSFIIVNCLSLSFPCSCLQMSSEIDTPCRDIPSLVYYCRRGQLFNLHVASLPFVYALRSVAAAHVDGKRCFDGRTTLPQPLISTLRRNR